MRLRSLLCSLLVVLASIILSRLSTIQRHLSAMSTARDELKNVVVVGGSYVGLATAKELVEALPSTHRVLVIEKNSHFSHLFAFPRFAVTPSFEHKAFVPYTTTLAPPHAVLRAKVLSITPTHLLLDRAVLLQSGGEPTTEIPHDGLVLATGTKLSLPGTMEGEEKREGVEWFKEHQKEVQEAERIVLLGGGAVGVQMATDIAELYPSKSATLIHSRQNLMPRFHPNLHTLIMKRFEELGITSVLGSRAKVPAGGFNGVRRVELEDGRIIEAELVIQSTGQTPLSGPLRSLAPSAILSSGFVKTKSTLQVDADEEGLAKVFAVGDIADSGAPKAARPGAVQSQVVARNLVKLLDGKDVELEAYAFDPAAIHLTLGIVKSVVFRNPSSSDPADPLGSFVGEPTFFWKEDGREDMGIEGVWARRAPGLVDYHL